MLDRRSRPPSMRRMSRREILVASSLVTETWGFDGVLGDGSSDEEAL